MVLPLVLQTLLGAQALTPAGKPPSRPYFVDTGVRIDGLFATDSGMDAFGILQIVTDGAVYEKENRIDAGFEVHLIDAPRDQFDRRELKFRYGATYSSIRTKLFKYDRTTSKWQIVLESPRPFSTFEVTFSGQILLFGTFANHGPKGTRQGKFLEKKDMQEGALIETWEVLGSDPVGAIPYDSADQELVKAVEGITSYDRTWMYRDWIVFYNTYTGRMGTYDLVKKALKWVKTPWDGVTLEGLKTWEMESKGLRDFKKADPIPIAWVDVPPEEGIQLCPDESSVRIAFSRGYLLPEDEARKKAAQKANPKPVVNLPIPISPDSKRDKVGIGILDLEKSEIIQNRLCDSIPQGQCWVNREGELVSLEKLLKQIQPDPAKKSEPGKTQGSGNTPK